MGKFFADLLYVLSCLLHMFIMCIIQRLPTRTMLNTKASLRPFVVDGGWMVDGCWMLDVGIVCMYVCHTHIHTQYTHTCTHIHIYTHTRIHTYTHTHIHTYTHTHIHIYTTHTHTVIHTYRYTHIHTIYTHTAHTVLDESASTVPVPVAGMCYVVCVMWCVSVSVCITH